MNRVRYSRLTCSLVFYLNLNVLNLLLVIAVFILLFFFFFLQYISTTFKYLNILPLHFFFFFVDKFLDKVIHQIIPIITNGKRVSLL